MLRKPRSSRFELTINVGGVKRLVAAFRSDRSHHPGSSCARARPSSAEEGSKNVQSPGAGSTCLPLLFALLLAAASRSQPTRDSSSIEFVDVTSLAGVEVQDLSGGPVKVSLLDTVGHGAAWLDYDQDGWLDLYVVNGSTLDRLKGRDKTPSPAFRLFRNHKDGTFSDETVTARVDGQGLWGMGVAAGDIDNDGYPDLYLTGFGRNILYHNRRNGTFQDITSKAGVEASGWSTSAAFGDYDLDGDLDLFVARYVDFDINHFPTGCLYSGIRVACGPTGLKALPDVLYRNNGDGTFREATSPAGIAGGEPYFGLGVIFFDYNHDGYPDLYVANDATPANLWNNNRDGTFSDRGTLAGCAFSGDGHEQARMGVDAGDYDRSGHPSIFTTNFSGEINSLFRNLGNGFFRDVSEEAGLGAPSIPYLGWGTKFVDYDNDGWEDLFVANGHLYPEVDAHRLSYSYRQRPLVFRNLGGKFQEVGLSLGRALSEALCARGAAFADPDNDGDTDVFIVTMDGLPRFLKNQGGNRNNFVTLRLVGTKSNRDGLGSKVRVTLGGSVRTAEVWSGGSYLSSNDPRAHFGLGSAQTVDSVEVLWPSGIRDRLQNVPVNQFLTIREGSTAR